MPYSRRASVYEVEYAEDRDRNFILSLIGETSRRVLEVPCGAGRLSRSIAELPIKLTVVDVEPAMVARTIDIIDRSAHRAIVTGEVADMRTVDLGRSFDLVLVPREALQLLPPHEGAQALARLADHTAPGGLLFLDLATFPRGRRFPTADPDYYDPELEDGAWIENWTRELDDGALLTRRTRQRHDAGSILIELDYQVEASGRSLDSWQSEMRLHRYGRTWLDAAKPDCLTLEGVYGGYDRSPFSAASPRLLALYRKNFRNPHQETLNAN